ncbi:hypothetical protein F5X98DRAFT_334190 [Xylaria grammica]|nr:hypothetical protein F5X98DRAFT_334190 [Xylaria grammica]
MNAIWEWDGEDIWHAMISPEFGEKPNNVIRSPSSSSCTMITPLSTPASTLTARPTPTIKPTPTTKPAPAIKPPPAIGPTPSQTATVSDSEQVYDAGSISPYSSVPEPGRTYMIRDLDSERVLTVADGCLTLTLAPDVGSTGGWQWHCEEHTSGWLGFRNAVSGKYIGHNNRGAGYVAKAVRFRSWEYFVLRPRQLGGYNLCVKWGHELKFVGTNTDENKNGNESMLKLVHAPTSDLATRWEFIRV